MFNKTYIYIYIYNSDKYWHKYLTHGRSDISSINKINNTPTILELFRTEIFFIALSCCDLFGYIFFLKKNSILLSQTHGVKYLVYIFDA